MNLCFDCKQKRSIKTIMGDGKCPKHGRYAFYDRFLKPVHFVLKKKVYARNVAKLL